MGVLIFGFIFCLIYIYFWGLFCYILLHIFKLHNSISSSPLPLLPLSLSLSCLSIPVIWWFNKLFSEKKSEKMFIKILKSISSYVKCDHLCSFVLSVYVQYVVGIYNVFVRNIIICYSQELNCRFVFSALCFYLSLHSVWRLPYETQDAFLF